MYRPRFLRRRFEAYAARAAVGSCPAWIAAGGLKPCRSMSQVALVGVPERDQRLAELLHGVKGLHPEQVLLEGADEALGAAVALGRADKSGRAFEAEDGGFLLQGVGQVLAPVVMADGKALGHVLGERPKAVPHALAALAPPSAWRGVRRGCRRTRRCGGPRR